MLSLNCFVILALVTKNEPSTGVRYLAKLASQTSFLQQMIVPPLVDITRFCRQNWIWKIFTPVGRHVLSAFVPYRFGRGSFGLWFFVHCYCAQLTFKLCQPVSSCFYRVCSKVHVFCPFYLRQRRWTYRGQWFWRRQGVGIFLSFWLCTGKNWHFCFCQNFGERYALFTVF